MSDKKLLDPDEEFELYENLSSDIHKLVNSTLDRVHSSNEENIRERLGEQFRFWI